MRLFFFSSRRRHTRYIGDWSSDVCSSDLGKRRRRAGAEAGRAEAHAGGAGAGRQGAGATEEAPRAVAGAERRAHLADQIGRASCRERVEITEVVATVKKETKSLRGADALE